MSSPDFRDIPRRSIPFHGHDPADGPRPRIIKHGAPLAASQLDPLEHEREARVQDEAVIQALDEERRFLHQERTLASQSVSVLQEELEHVLGNGSAEETEEDEEALFRHRELRRERAELVVRAGNRMDLRAERLERFRSASASSRPSYEDLCALREELESDLGRVDAMQTRFAQAEAEARIARAVRTRLETDLAHPVYLLEQLRSVLS